MDNRITVREALGDPRARAAADALCANVVFAEEGGPIRSVAVVGASPGDGKTTVCALLAAAFAARGERVLAVDCDLRRHRLAAALGAARPSGGPGLWACAAGSAHPEEAVRPTALERLWVLDAEPGGASPSRLLSSARFAGLLEGLCRSWGRVVLDTPPLGAVVDAALVAAEADAAVLVARRGRTRRDALRGAMAQLRKAGANVVGAVVNEDEWSEPYDDYYLDAHRGEGRPAAPAHGTRFKQG